MTKPIGNIRVGAPASIYGSQSVSEPILRWVDDPVAFVQRRQELSATPQPNNPILTRAQDAHVSDGGSKVGTAVAGGAATLTALLGSTGCGTEGTLAVTAIALAWGLLTVGAWGGILLGLNKIAGMLAGEAVGSDNVGKFIKKGDWQSIEKALLDEYGDPKELTKIQGAVLKASDKIPPYMQPWMYKAVAVANGDSDHVAAALDGLLASDLGKDMILHTLMNIVQAYLKKPNKDAEASTFVARAVVNFEWQYPGHVRDTLLANAVALSHYWQDSVILIGTLATRVRIGNTMTNAYLIGALRHLRDKPFCNEVFHRHLPPFLVGVDGVKPYWEKNGQ